MPGKDLPGESRHRLVLHPVRIGIIGRFREMHAQPHGPLAIVLQPDRQARQEPVLGALAAADRPLRLFATMRAAQTWIKRLATRGQKHNGRVWRQKFQRSWTTVGRLPRFCSDILRRHVSYKRLLGPLDVVKQGQRPMSTQLTRKVFQSERLGHPSLSNRVSRSVLIGLPITTLAVCLGVAGNANPIIQRSAGTAPAAVALDGSAIDECQGNSGGGGGNSGGGGGNSGGGGGNSGGGGGNSGGGGRRRRCRWRCRRRRR